MLKLQCFGHLILRADSLEKTLILGKVEGKGRRVAEDEIGSITDSTDINVSKLWGIVEDRGAWQCQVHGSQRVGHDLVTEQQHPERCSFPSQLSSGPKPHFLSLISS